MFLLVNMVCGINRAIKHIYRLEQLLLKTSCMQYMVLGIFEVALLCPAE